MRLVSLYFAAVAVLTAPLWVLDSATQLRLLPGLPASALAVLCPTLAAAIVSYSSGGRSAVLEVLVRGLDARKAGWRLVPVALVNPVLFGAALLISRHLGEAIPDPQLSLATTMGLAALFLPAALLEEIGWTSFALDRLQAGLGALGASLIVGLVWAVWHVPALMHVGHSIDWIAWWSLWTISARVVMVWLYNQTSASVFAVALFHAMSNLCWQLYPINGSHFDPRISGLITLGLALALSAWSLGARRRSA